MRKIEAVGKGGLTKATRRMLRPLKKNRPGVGRGQPAKTLKSLITHEANP